MPRRWSELPPVPPPFDGVRVFHTRLDAFDEATDELMSRLDSVEQGRAAAFRHDFHRELFVRRRWWLREVIAALAQVDPTEVRIEHDALGRPSLIAPERARGWELSTSHGGVLAVLAVSPGRRVGIDVVEMDESHVTLDAARIFMREAERAEFESQPEHRRTRTFYHFWARKEAVLKALGTGLALDPRTIDVRGPRVVVPGGDSMFVMDLSLQDRRTGALAVAAESEPPPRPETNGP